MQDKPSPFATYCYYVLIGAVLLAVRWSIASPYCVPTPSMEPTIKVGDRVIGNHLAYGLRLPFTNHWLASWGIPSKGDIVIFPSVEDPEVTLVKRVVATAGDSVSFHQNHLFINHQEQEMKTAEENRWLLSDATDHPENKLLYDENLAGRKHLVELDPTHQQLGVKITWPADGKDYIVPEGRVFVSGDNRDNSNDSRYWGAVPVKTIVAQASTVFWSAYFDHGSAVPTIRFSRFFSPLDHAEY